MVERNRPSVPYARLSGTWEVLERTPDGRTTVAVREDDVSGVAMSYPYAEREGGDDDVNKIAAVTNCEAGYVLVSASVVDADAVYRLVADRTVVCEAIPRPEFNRLEDDDIVRTLAGDRVVVVEPETDDWFVGTVELFRDRARARSAWFDGFPLLERRAAAVQRLLDGVGLRQVASAVERRRSRGPNVRSP